MTAPRNRWLIAGTPTNKPYPCRCSVKRRCQAAPTAFCCPCTDRVDTDHLPSHCCAKRAADTKERTDGQSGRTAA